MANTTIEVLETYDPKKWDTCMACPYKLCKHNKFDSRIHAPMPQDGCPVRKESGLEIIVAIRRKDNG